MSKKKPIRGDLSKSYQTEENGWDREDTYQKVSDGKADTNLSQITN